MQTAVRLAGSFHATFAVFAGDARTGIGLTEAIDATFGFFTHRAGADTLLV